MSEIVTALGTSYLEIQTVIPQVDIKMKDLHIWIHRWKFWQAFHMGSKNSVATLTKYTLLDNEDNMSLSKDRYDHLFIIKQNLYLTVEFIAEKTHHEPWYSVDNISKQLIRKHPWLDTVMIANHYKLNTSVPVTT
jgi:hypothetical protein